MRRIYVVMGNKRYEKTTKALIAWKDAKSAQNYATMFEAVMGGVDCHVEEIYLSSGRLAAKEVKESA